jgi:hypothetical protein
MFSRLHIVATLLILSAFFPALSVSTSSAQGREPSYVGVEIRPLIRTLPTKAGKKTIFLEIFFVADESPASEAGLRKGDLIFGIGK